LYQVLETSVVIVLTGGENSRDGKKMSCERLNSNENKARKEGGRGRGGDSAKNNAEGGLVGGFGEPFLEGWGDTTNGP